MSGASISYPHQRRRVCLPSSRSGGEAPSGSLSLSQSRPEPRSATMATCYPAYELPSPQRSVQVPPPSKDYSRPLHVDCSVEYELPNTAKPPAGVRNEPLLMIHPCYFRKIESQRRSPFVNNLPTATATAAKRRRPQPPAQYPPPPWDQPPPAAPPPNQGYGCKQPDAATAWTEPDRSPDRPPEERHILSGKYRQYLRAHRLHPYVASAIPLASTFPQIQQVCYNV